MVILEARVELSTKFTAIIFFWNVSIGVDGQFVFGFGGEAF